MKALKRFVAAIVAIGTVAVLSMTAIAATELRWATVSTDSDYRTIMMQQAADEINEKAEDVHVTVYSGGSLGGSQELVEGLQEGMVEMITEGPAQFGTWIPKAAQVEAPYLWQSPQHLIDTLNGEYKESLNELFGSINVRILGSLYYGTRQLTTKKEVHTVADLDGMKIRVPETDLYVKMVESWGAAATPMNLNELYMALQNGTVDAQENPLATFKNNKFYEVVNYVILTDHIICPSMVFINEDVWDGISEGDQQIIQEAVSSAIEWNNEETLALEESLTTELQDEYGCTIITPDDTIRQATISAIQPLIDDWDLIQTYAESDETEDVTEAE